MKSAASVIFDEWVDHSLKECFKCGEFKPHNKEHFHLGVSKKRGTATNMMSMCKACKKKAEGETNAIKKNHARPPIGTKCAICPRTDQKLVCDHKDGTKRLRGWICSGCNKMLGFAKDNPETLEAAAQYLRDSI